MSSGKDRRYFLKLSGLTGMGIVSGLFNGTAFAKDTNDLIASGGAKFNMCNYQAPRLDTVRVGFIGLGHRGPTHLRNMSRLDNVDIKGLCDIRPEYANHAKDFLKGTKHNPAIYSGASMEWKKLCDRPDVDLVFIATPWAMHVPMAVYAMEQGKHVCVEVPAAVTLDECWRLVETSENTKKHCMMMENCCYDFFELLTLNMARDDFFGEILHGEGAYIHNLLELNFRKEKGYWEMWRLRENMKRNGNLYPTHGLGPICQIMNINRGDRLDSLVSRSGKDFSMGIRAKELAANDSFYAPYANGHFRGNMNVTNIVTGKGKTITIYHDVSSPNVYSRVHKVVGTRGTALKYPLPAKISSGGEKWVSDEEMRTLEKKYQPAIVKKIGELAKQIGGHGGMDFLMDWRTIDCLRNGLPLDQDVYDAALWSAIAPLSEASVANNSNPVRIPDFTKGAWRDNTPVNITIESGGNTKILK